MSKNGNRRRGEIGGETGGEGGEREGRGEGAEGGGGREGREGRDTARIHYIFRYVCTYSTRSVLERVESAKFDQNWLKWRDRLGEDRQKEEKESNKDTQLAKRNELNSGGTGKEQDGIVTEPAICLGGQDCIWCHTT